jgi:hypothetical protein
MAANTSWINNSSTVTTPSAFIASTNSCLLSKASEEYTVVSKPNQALKQTLKPLPRSRDGSNLTRSTTTSSASSSFESTATSASLVLLNSDLSREKSLIPKTNTTFASTATYINSDSGCDKTECNNDREWIDLWLLNTKDNNKSKEDHLSQWNNWKQVTDVHVTLRDSASNCCDSALRILSDEPQQRQIIDSYKKELLLDNMKFLQQYNEAAGCLDGDIDGNGDLDDLDLEDDVESLDDEIDLSADVVEYHIPLCDDKWTTISCSYRYSSSYQNNPSTNYQQELLLDGYVNDMNRVLTQFRHQYVEEQDDLLSRGDLESCGYDDIEDGVTISSDSDCSAGYPILEMHSCE